MINEELIEIALGEYAVEEIPGEEDNPRILQYFAEIGHQWVKDDETAWCSAFVNWVATKAGYERSNKLNARSWLDIGVEITGGAYKYVGDLVHIGDVLIFWRESKDSWKGHVGFYINEDEDYYYVLGGNQGNKVQISKYPKSRLLGIRRLRKITDLVNE